VSQKAGIQLIAEFKHISATAQSKEEHFERCGEALSYANAVWKFEKEREIVHAESESPRSDFRGTYVQRGKAGRSVSLHHSSNGSRSRYFASRGNGRSAQRIERRRKSLDSMRAALKRLDELQESKS